MESSCSQKAPAGEHFQCPQTAAAPTPHTSGWLETLAKSCVEKLKSTAHVPVATLGGSVTVAHTLEEIYSLSVFYKSNQMSMP